MSAQVVEIRHPYLRIDELADHIDELIGDIPCPDSHRDYMGEDGKYVIGDWEGASPDGYVYAPQSEGELREAAELLTRVDRLLQAVRAREWPRCGNEVDGCTLEAYLKGRREG